MVQVGTLNIFYLMFAGGEIERKEFYDFGDGENEI